MGKPDTLSCHSDHGNGSADNTDIVLLLPKLFAIRVVEGVKLIGMESDILRNIRKGIKSEEPREELVAQAVKAMRGSKTKSLRSAEWSESEGLVYFCRPPTSAAALSRSVMILRSPVTQVALKPSNLLHRITGGHTCPNMWEAM